MIWILAGAALLLALVAGLVLLMGHADAMAEQDDRTYGTRRY